MKPHFIIFSGYNERSVFSFLREVTAHNADYSIIANGQNDRIFASVYAEKVVFSRQTPELSHEYIIPALSAACAAHKDKRHIVAPSSEALNLFLLDHENELRSLNITLPLVDKKLYSLVSNKGCFTKLCSQHGLHVPRQLPDAQTAPLPFVAKPIMYGKGSFLHPVIISTEAERKFFLRTAKLEKYFFQEFVQGKSIYLLMHIARNGVVTAYSQENLIQQPDGKSIIAAKAASLHLEPIQKQYEKMLLAIGFFGLIMIELREGKNCFFMIEANPRFWGPSQLFVDAMPFNLFQSFLQEYGVQCRLRETLPHQRYYWHEGFLSTLKEGKQPVFHNYSYQQYAQELDLWMEADIYRRTDTMNIFQQTLAGETR